MRFTFPKGKSRKRILFVRSSGRKEADDGATATRVVQTNKVGRHYDSVNMAMLQPFPSWLSPVPAIDDTLETESSHLQDATAEECLPHLLGQLDDASSSDNATLPELRRSSHASFLRKALGRLPKQFTALDASRPWMLYWCLNGLSVLGEDVSSYRQK